MATTQAEDVKKKDNEAAYIINDMEKKRKSLTITHLSAISFEPRISNILEELFPSIAPQVETTTEKYEEHCLHLAFLYAGPLVTPILFHSLGNSI